jgi:hypothetical protein
MAKQKGLSIATIITCWSNDHTRGILCSNNNVVAHYFITSPVLNRERLRTLSEGTSDLPLSFEQPDY